MEIVIKIEEPLYNTIMCSPNSPTLGWYEIAHGTVLPNGHGRLIDADAYRKDMMDSREFNFFKILDMQSTIVEADRESDNG